MTDQIATDPKRRHAPMVKDCSVKRRSTVLAAGVLALPLLCFGQTTPGRQSKAAKPTSLSASTSSTSDQQKATEAESEKRKTSYSRA